MAKAEILIVERIECIAEGIQKDLEEMGFHVSAILSSGEQAAKRVKEDAPDLVLMDIELDGEMSGLDAAELIRSQFHIPVVYLVDYARADKKGLEQTGIKELRPYIVKPIKRRELHTAIEGALFRHKMEQRLEHSEAWLSTILRCISDAVIAIDMQGLIASMNLAAQDLTGWNHKEAVGRSYQDVFKIISEQTGELVEDFVSKTIQRGMTNQTVLTARDGMEIPIDCSSTPVRDKRGDTIGAALVFRDIRQRRQALDIRARNIVPKLNNILMGIQAHTYLMIVDMQSSHPHFDHLQGIEEYVRKAASLTNQLLNWKKGQGSVGKT